jgi:hypothetical protein
MGLQVSKVVIPPSRDGKERNYGFIHFEDRAVVTQLVANSEKGVKPSLDGNELEVCFSTHSRLVSVIFIVSCTLWHIARRA